MGERRTKINFKATKMVPKPSRVEFYTKTGEKVSFKSIKEVPRPIKVEFYAKKK